MKKIALIPMALVFAIVGCGGDDDSGATDSLKTPTTTSSATMTTAQLQEAASKTVPGFTTSEVRANPIGVTATYTSTATTSGGAQVVVLLQLAPCDPFICGKLDPAEYQTAEAQRNLKSTLSTAHIENPDLKWDFGEVELGSGATGLYTYALSYIETKDTSGGTTRISANSYRAWYHNGATLVSMDVFSRGGDSVRSVADLEQRMSRTEAETAAKTFFAALAPQLFK